MKEDVGTIRQAIKDSLDITEDTEIIIDGEKQISHGILPLPFPYLLQNMAGILYLTTAQLLKKPMDDEIFGVLSGRDFIQNMPQFIQLRKFLEWWLEREAVIDISTDDSDGIFWYDLKEMCDAWNECLENEVDEREKTGFFRNR